MLRDRRRRNRRLAPLGRLSTRWRLRRNGDNEVGRSLIVDRDVETESRAEKLSICADLEQLGIVLDHEKNKLSRATEAVISAPGSRVKVLVIPTNEELVVAREVKRFLQSPKSEIRNPKEIRRPKSESATVRSSVSAQSKSFRTSDFVLPSDFGFRFSDFTTQPSTIN